MDTISVYRLEYDLDRKCRLVKECGTGFDKEIRVNEAKKVYEILEPVFRVSIQPEEFMYLICCDNKMRVNGLFTVSHGGIAGTLQNIRGIFVRALLCNAKQIIVAHNHPSGECEPSRKDILCNAKLEKACDLMEIPLTDNIILGNGRYYSFKDDKETIVY